MSSCNLFHQCDDDNDEHDAKSPSGLLCLCAWFCSYTEYATLLLSSTVWSYLCIMWVSTRDKLAFISIWVCVCVCGGINRSKKHSQWRCIEFCFTYILFAHTPTYIYIYPNVYGNKQAFMWAPLPPLNFNLNLLYIKFT